MHVAREQAVAPEINVLPLIDVLLVMIVMFFLLQKVRQVTDVQLPPPVTGPTSRTDQIVVEVAADGAITVNRQPVVTDQLGNVLQAIYQDRPQKILFIKAHGDRTYDEVVHVIDVAKGAGVQVFGMVPKPAAR